MTEPTDPLPAHVRKALQGLEAGLDPLAADRALRRALPAADVRVAAEQAHLRARGAIKFPGLVDGVFTAQGLEQASDPRAAAARAQRIAQRSPAAWVLDATCSLGADARALARAGLRVVAADRDAHLVRMAAWNCRAASGLAEGSPVAAIVADALRPAARTRLLVADPDRRPQGERRGDPRLWSPPLAELLHAAQDFAGACLKLAPAFDVDRWCASAPDPEPRSWQWISVAGELKETVLWTGELAGPNEREVLVLQGDAATHLAGTPEECAPLDAEAAAVVRVIAEPDPALIRSGLLGLVANRESLAPLGPQIAYLGGSAAPNSPLLRSWHVIDSAPADSRRVRRMLAEHDVGALTVKKRGHPDSADVLARRLGGKGARRGVLVVTRLARGHRAYLVE